MIGAGEMDAVFLALFGLGIAAQIWALVIAARNSAHGRPADWSFGAPEEDRRELFKIRVVLFIAFAGLITEALFDYMNGGLAQQLMWTHWLGLAVFWAGTLLLIVATKTLGTSFSPTEHLSADHHLVTSGPYGFVRHPIYLSNIITWIGFLTVYFSWIFFIVIGLHMTYLLSRIPREETALSELYGDVYRSYLYNTGMLVPSPRRLLLPIGLARVSSPGEFQQKPNRVRP